MFIHIFCCFPSFLLPYSSFNMIMLEGRQPNVMAGRFLQSGAILHTSPFTFTAPFILQMMIPKWSLLQIEALQFTQIYSRALSSSRPYQALKKFVFNVDDSHASPFTFTTLYFYKQTKNIIFLQPFILQTFYNVGNSLSFTFD